MNNKLGILFNVFLAGTVIAEESDTSDSSKTEDTLQVPITPEKSKSNSDAKTALNPALEKAVNEALIAIQKDAPAIHEDSLRIWKNFKKNASKQVNFTYRFWGRRLILWLKENKQVVFNSEEKVGEVFKILWRKGLISMDAVVVLMVDAWSHLVYLEGSPDWEKSEEKRQPQGGMAAPTAKKGEQGI